MSEKISNLTRFWNYLKRTAMVTGFFVLGSYLLIGIFIVYAMMGNKGTSSGSLKAQPKDNYMLHIELDGALVDAMPSQSMGFDKLFKKEKVIYLRTIQSLIKKAQSQDQVKGIFLDLSGFKGSLTAISELRKSLNEFKTKHSKPIWVWAPSYNTSNYYLASVADKVFLPNMGMVEIVGSAFQMVFISGTLEKVGVEFEVFKAGKYKSAMEPLILDQPSESALEEYTSMQESMLKLFAEEISKSRGVSEEDVRVWMKQSLFSDEDAKNKKIIDDLGFSSTLVEQFEKQLGVSESYSYKEAKYFKYSIDEALVGAKTGKGIALIEAFGQIDMNPKGDAFSDEQNINVEHMIAKIRWAKDQEDAAAVVLHIDSPGGSALASEIILDELKKLAEQKPIVVVMGNVAASGGYFLATIAKSIIAHKLTITGSIGVIGAMPNLAKAQDKFGFKFYTITQSDRRNLIDPGKRNSAEDTALLSKQIGDVYIKFKQHVADGRSMDLQKVEDLAQGRVYTGIQAMELGLIDEFGGVIDGFKKAKEIVGLDPEKSYPLYTYVPEDTDILSCLAQSSALKCVMKYGMSVSIDTIISKKIAQYPQFKALNEQMGFAKQIMSGQERIYLRAPDFK